MVGKGANSIRVVPFHSIMSSGIRRLSNSGRWRERRPAMCRFVPSPTNNTVRSNACELRRTSRGVVGVQLDILFELRDCRPSALWRAKLTTLKRFPPFVQIRELRRPVTCRQQRSGLHRKTNYVVSLQSELSRIGRNGINGGEVCEPH
jgi:hypothetical protein